MTPINHTGDMLPLGVVVVEFSVFQKEVTYFVLTVWQRNASELFVKAVFDLKNLLSTFDKRVQNSIACFKVSFEPKLNSDLG